MCIIKPKIVFILESISQPRCIKRINSFISQGFDVDVYGIDRGKYNENATISGIEINIIGKQTDGEDYFNKLINNNRAVKNILKSYISQETVFYVFGFALTLSLKINGCKNYVYEISDILYGYKKFNLIRPFFKIIDKLLIKKSLITVLTSEGFANFLFDDNWPNNIIIQPNRLNVYFRNIQRSYKPFEFDTRGYRFAYVGAFRYPNTIFRFAQIIGEHFPQNEFHFYGDSKLTEHVIRLSKKYDNVKYFGSFKNPDDLESIYNNFDIIVACYDIQSLNERIAEPNKLYEALFFNKPIIVSKNTFLSEKVNKLNCGFAIDASNDQSIISFLDSLKINELNIIKKNISTIKYNEIIDDDSASLISLLKEMILKL
jgi:succinoglycan biosynthesis protein ExoL